MPWWGWIQRQIEAVPDQWYDLILISMAVLIIGAVFLPKAAKVATIAWVVSP